MKNGYSLILIVLIIFSVNINMGFSRKPVDARMLHAINSCDGKGWTNFNKFLSNSEIFVLAAVPVGIGIYGVATGEADELDRVVNIAASYVTTYALSSLMKVIVKRERPYDKYPGYIHNHATESSYSFPSSHTSGAFSLATTLTLSYKKWYITAPAFVWATAVGYSRMQLGVHYPSDVLAGAVLGSACAWGSYELTKLLVKERKKRDFNYWLKNDMLY